MEYYMAAWRYEISLLVLKKCFTCSLRSLVKYFSTLEVKVKVTLLKVQPHYYIVRPVVKMQLHPATHPHQPLIRRSPPRDRTLI